MWTEPLKNGKYKAVERYTDPITGKQKKISCVIERDTRMARKEAQKKLDEKIEAILGKTDYDKMTFKQLCERYLENYDGKESGKYSVSIVINRLLDKIGEARINRLTASYVMDKLNEESATKYNSSIGKIKTIISWGYRHDYVADKTWINKLQPKTDNRKIRIEDKYLEQDELEKLLQAMKNREHWQLLTKFLALSGLRIGEALALNMRDLDTSIHVTKTLYMNLDIISDTPKTPESNRDVFIQPELAEVISDVRKWRLAYMMSNAIRTDLLFPDLRYRSYEAYLVRKSMQVLGRSITPHALRHTHVSLLAAAGVSLDTIARRLGHTDDKITRSVYFHVTEKLIEKENEQLSKVKLL